MNTYKVPGIGPKEARIAIIGNAPGFHEVRLGAPFVGPAGDMLTKMLASAGINKSSIYITNVVKERPDDDDISQFIRIRGSSVSTTNAYKRYEAELYEELNDVKANVLVPLGNVPLYAITRKLGITSWRGSIIQSIDELGARKTIPSIHPSAILKNFMRNFMYYYAVVCDFKRIASESFTPDIPPCMYSLIVDPTYIQCIDFMEQILANHKIVAFDIETSMSNFGLLCFSLATADGAAISIPMIKNSETAWDFDDEVRIIRLLGKILEDESIVKVGQNMAFDAYYMLRNFGMIVKPIEDTMVAQAIIAPGLPKGLDYLCSIYTIQPYYKDDGKQWQQLKLFDERKFWRYNALDAAVCMECWHKLHKDLVTCNTIKTYETQRNMIEPVLFMQYRGIKANVASMAEQAAKCRNRQSEIRREIEALTSEHDVHGINLDSPAQLMDYFYNKLEIVPYKNRKTGNATIDATALKRLARRGYREASLILEYRSLGKLASSYLEVTLDKDNRLRGAYNVVGTTSLRLSSHKTFEGTGINMQTMPHSIRELLVPDDGYVGVSVDLSQAENRIVAYIAPEHNMIQAFENGIDMHRLTASMIFSKPIESISSEPGSASLGDGTMSERDWGKKANHSLNYGLKPQTFSLMYEIPVSDGKFVHDAFHRAYPGIRQFHNWIQAELNRSRTITNCFGYAKRFLDRWGDELFKSAYSFIPQSTVATQVNTRGILYMYNNCDLFEPVEILNQIHDSIELQIPLSIGWAQILKILQTLVQSLETPIVWKNSSFVIPAEVSIGNNFGKLRKINIKTADSSILESTWNLLTGGTNDGQDS